jgi:hypothetical protein
VKKWILIPAGVVAVLALLVMFFRPSNGGTNLDERPFDTVVLDANAKRIRHIEQSGRRVTVERQDGSKYRSEVPEDISDLLRAAGVSDLPEIEQTDYPWYLDAIVLLLRSLIPLALLFFVGRWAYRRIRPRIRAVNLNE